jgi:glycosyltransferase involved in cell wall biosynthesis
MLTHSYYEEDARVRREAEALVTRGREVDVFALRRASDGPTGELNGVRVERLDVQRHQGAGIPVYLVEYLRFLALAALAATRAHRRRRYGLVQVHTLPDFLVFAAVPLRLVGVPVLLDLHEAMPEFFRSRFPKASSRVAYTLLRWQERASIRFADAVVTVNESLAARLREIGVPAPKVSVVLNSPDLQMFDPAGHGTRPFMAEGTLRLVYAGAITPTYELEVCLRALARLRELRPMLVVRLDLYGRGDQEGELGEMAVALGVADRARLHGRIPLEDVPAAIAAADIGIAPTRRDAFTDMSLSTKIFEYAAMGKPVVASRLASLTRYFPEGTVATYEPGDPEALAAAILELVDDPGERDRRIERTRECVEGLSWDLEAERYAALVERVARG